MSYFVFALLLLLFEKSQCQQQVISVAPLNTSVLVGKEATLLCTVSNQQGEVTWCKETFCDATKGEHNLVIRNTTIHDDLAYQCQVSASEKSLAVKSSFVHLAVLVKPTVVRLVLNIKNDNDSVKLVMKQNSAIECISEDSNPPVDFKWYLDNELLSQGGDVIEMSKRAEKHATTKLFKTTGKLVVKVDNDGKWNQKQVKCEAFSEATKQLNVEMTDQKAVIVHYPPISTIVKMTSVEMVEEEVVEFECAADSRPPVTNYKWYIDTKVYSTGPGEKFLTLKIENSMHKKLLKCDATNEVATQTSSYLLEITYRPKFTKQLASHKLIGLSEKLVLNCEVDSNPPASIFWKLNGTLVYAYPNFTVDSMNYENYGTYTCEASLKNFPVISSSIKVIAPGAPIVEAESVQYAFVGYEAIIEAITENEPKPDSVLWFKDKVALKASAKYQLGSKLIPSKGIKHVLRINAVEQDDFTNYTFYATNKYGESRLQILLHPKANQVEQNSILISTVAIIFLIFLTVGLCILIRYCKSQDARKKKLRHLKQKVIMKRIMNQNLANQYQPFYTNIDNPYVDQNRFDMQRLSNFRNSYESYSPAAEYEMINSRKQTPDYYYTDFDELKRMSKYQTDV